MNIRKFGESVYKKVIILFFAITLLNFISSLAGAETIQYIYDEARQIKKVIYGDGTTIEYVYDGSGNRMVKTITFAGAPTNNPPNAQSMSVVKRCKRIERPD
jgi:YD repeat-containing protein